MKKIQSIGESRDFNLNTIKAVNDCYSMRGFKISYNPYAYNIHRKEDEAQTCLIIENVEGVEDMWILTGDFIKNYEHCKNANEALAVYNNMKGDFASTMTQKEPFVVTKKRLKLTK